MRAFIDPFDKTHIEIAKTPHRQKESRLRALSIISYIPELIHEIDLSLTGNFTGIAYAIQTFYMICMEMEQTETSYLLR